MSNQVTLDDVLDRLQGVRKSSHKRAMARCPAHADSDPSLSVSEGSTCIIMHCFAGCDFVEIVKAIGLEPQQLLYELSPEGVVRKPFWQRDLDHMQQMTMKGDNNEDRA
jgi:hypothetical protein